MIPQRSSRSKRAASLREIVKPYHDSTYQDVPARAFVGSVPITLLDAIHQAVGSEWLYGRNESFDAAWVLDLADKFPMLHMAAIASFGEDEHMAPNVSFDIDTLSADALDAETALRIFKALQARSPDELDIDQEQDGTPGWWVRAWWD